MEEMDAKKKFVTDEKKKYVKLHIFRECVRAGARVQAPADLWDITFCTR